MRTARVTMTQKLTWAQQTALDLMQKWGLTNWKFAFNRRKKGLGLCRHPLLAGGPGRIELSMYFAEANSQEEVLDTILHEIAHAKAGPNVGHGPEWKRWCQVVGAKPERCKEDVAMPAGKWQARCGKCLLLYHKHRQPRRLDGWHCRNCGPVHGALTFKCFT